MSNSRGQQAKEGFYQYMIDRLFPPEFTNQVTETYIENIGKIVLEKNMLNAISYNAKFLETNDNTTRCTYDKYLVCDNNNFNDQIERFLQLDEIKRKKTIYFHDKFCHNIAVVDNNNAATGEVAVNLSYF